MSFLTGNISYLWYPSVGTATAVIVGLLLSFLTGKISIYSMNSIISESPVAAVMISAIL